MSGSLDLQSVKTQQLILQNPDGSFPAAGGILAIVDSHGKVGTVSDISVGTVTVESVNITGAILQNNITATEIQSTTGRATTTNVSGLLTADDISATGYIYTSYLATEDLSSGSIKVLKTDIGTLITPQLNVFNDISAQIINGNSVSANDLYGENGIFTILTAPDISVSETSTAVLLKSDNVNSLSALFDNVYSQSGTITTATVTADVSANNLTVGVATIASDVSVNNLNVTGTFNFNQLNLNTVKVNGLLKATTKINTRNITVPRSTFGDLSAEIYDISSLNVSSLHNVNSLVAISAVVTDLSSQTVRSKELRVTGSSIFNSLNSNTLFATAATITDVSATNLYAPTVNATVDVSLNKGILTYVAPSTLNVDGISTKTTEAYVQQPYYSSYVQNDLATSTDISNTMLDLATNFNNFMNIFSERGLAVNPFIPGYKFNSPVSIQFTIRGVTQAPITFAVGSYTLTQVLATLNAVSPVLKFVAIPPKVITKPGWQVRLDVSGGGANTYIGDVSGSDISGGGAFIYSGDDISGVPTSSLQMMRFLGFVINDTANPFQIYTFSGSEAVSTTLYNISGSYISTGAIGILSNFPVMPVPTYTYTATSSSLTITLTNMFSSKAKYVVIYLLNQYFLYNVTYNIITFKDLGFSTTYPMSIMYLDNYNRAVLNTTLTTQPLAVSSTTTFNSIRLSWVNPGNNYILRISAAGQFITPTLLDISNTSYTYTNLLRNSPYVFNVYCLDPVYNISGSATVVNVTTPDPFPADQDRFYIFYKTVPNYTYFGSPWDTNIVAGIKWTYPPPAGASIIIYYDISGGSKQTANVQPGIEFLTNDLSGTGYVSCTIFYTDNSRNTVSYSSLNVSHPYPFGRIPYTTSFGFARPPGYNQFGEVSVNTVGPYLSIDNVTNFGLGYFPTGTHGTSIYSIQDLEYLKMYTWMGNKFTNITFFKGVRNITASPVTLVANIYYIPISDYSKGWNGKFPAWYNPLYSYNPAFADPSYNFIADLTNAYGVAITSNPSILAANTNWRNDFVLTFPTTVNMAENMLILIQKTAGGGTAEFATFSLGNNHPVYPTNYDEVKDFTAVSYDGTKLRNTMLPPGVGTSSDNYAVVLNFNL